MKVQDVFKEKTFAVKVSPAAQPSLPSEHTMFLCINSHCVLGLTEVGDLEAWSAGAVQRGSHHSGITVILEYTC